MQLVVHGNHVHAYATGGPLKFFEELKNQRRLTETRLCNQGHKTAIGLEGIEKRRQRLTVALPKIEKARIRFDAEGLLSHLVKTKKHKAYISRLGKLQFTTGPQQPSFTMHLGEP